MEITKGQIGNALTSVAADHVVAVANDIYDEALGKYQSEINAEPSSGSLEEWQTNLLNNLYGSGTVKSFGNPIAYQETVSIPYNFTQYGENSVKTIPIPKVTNEKAGVLSNYDYRDLMEGLTKVTENIEPWIEAIQRTGFVSDIDTEATKNALNVKVFITNDTIEGNGIWKSVSIPINSTTQACLIAGNYYDWLSKLEYELTWESSIIRHIDVNSTADSLTLAYEYIHELGGIGNEGTYRTTNVNIPIVSDTNAGVLSAAQYKSLNELQFFKGHNVGDDLNDVDVDKHINVLTLSEMPEEGSNVIYRSLDLNSAGPFDGAEVLLFIHNTQDQVQYIIDVPGFQADSSNTYPYDFKLYGVANGQQGIELNDHTGDIVISCTWIGNTWHVRKV